MFITNLQTQQLEMRMAQNHWVQMYTLHIKCTAQEKNVLPVCSVKRRRSLKIQYCCPEMNINKTPTYTYTHTHLCMYTHTHTLPLQDQSQYSFRQKNLKDTNLFENHQNNEFRI